MGYDFFVGTLLCPVCGAYAPRDSSTNMQTKIRDEPDLVDLGVGDPLIIDPETVEQRGYLVVRQPALDEAIYMLDTWECPNCGFPYNWAEIVVQDNLIQDVFAVPLDKATLEGANYISTECISTVTALTGRSFLELNGADLVQILRDRL
jgi:rubredoxin